MGTTSPKPDRDPDSKLHKFKLLFVYEGGGFSPLIFARRLIAVLLGLGAVAGVCDRLGITQQFLEFLGVAPLVAAIVIASTTFVTSIPGASAMHSPALAAIVVERHCRGLGKCAV